jgi:predicted Rossmann fold nucleotide-binding protein DprA/Smf involved in DNA uptake
MIYGVIGSREPSKESYKALWDHLMNIVTSNDTIVTGGAMGGDTLGMRMGYVKQIPICVYCPKGTYNFKAVNYLEKCYKNAVIQHTGLSYSDRDKLIAHGCDVLYMPDYGNGSLSTARLVLSRGCSVYTTGSYKLIGNAKRYDWSDIENRLIRI